MKSKKNIPPKFAERFLLWFLRDDLAEEVLGDLDEQFYSKLEESSALKAKLNYWYQVIHYLRPFAIRNLKSIYSNHNHYTMYRSYFKIFWRNLIKNKAHTLITIGGLALGMAVALLIGLWIYDEISYNKYFSHYDRIAQVWQKETFQGQSRISRFVQRPLEFELRNKYGSDFEKIVMAFWEAEYSLAFNETIISRKGRFMQDGAPSLLSLNMIQGTRDGLKEPASILLAASTAKALFGQTDPMGKTVRVNDKLDVAVGGVYEDLPYNTDFKNLKYIINWEMLPSLNPWVKDDADNWGNDSFTIYVQLNPHSTFENVSEKIKRAKYEHMDEEEKRLNNETFLNPMSRWHLYGDWQNGVNVGGRIQYVWLFGIIGTFVLLIACINFINLSTARSEKRAKGIGISKVIGSTRGQLIRQFLSESFAIATLAFLVALLLVGLSLSWFNDLADKKMMMPWNNLYFLLISPAFIFLISIMAGSYPAFFLASFNPVKALKGNLHAHRFAALPRKILVVVQFTVSITLIIGTIIVYRQILHAQNRPVGYSQAGLITVPMRSPDYLPQKMENINWELKEAGLASEVAQSSSPINALWSHTTSFTWPGKDDQMEVLFGLIFITFDYGNTVNWQIIEGRDFSRELRTDSVSNRTDPTNFPTSVIVNEAAVKHMNLTNPVGEIFKYGDQSLEIIGIIKDMIIESPYEPIRPMVYLVNYPQAINFTYIKLNPNISLKQALPQMETVFKKHAPAVPFDYEFADEIYGEKFESEVRLGKLAGVFAVLAILISCLGLQGLASFMAEQRTKEIGIRKVLGASVANLWQMLSQEFIVLVIISFLISAPIAYYFMDKWLQDYNYRTDLSWWIFASAGAGAIFITYLTVSFQAIKAAIMNPVKSLRSE